MWPDFKYFVGFWFHCRGGCSVDLQNGIEQLADILEPCCEPNSPGFLLSDLNQRCHELFCYKIMQYGHVTVAACTLCCVRSDSDCQR